MATLEIDMSGMDKSAWARWVLTVIAIVVTNVVVGGMYVSGSMRELQENTNRNIEQDKIIENLRETTVSKQEAAELKASINELNKDIKEMLRSQSERARVRQ